MKAKVVVEEMKGMPNFRAAALPHTAMESATMQSGCSARMSRQSVSSSASVVSTSRCVEKARSLPRRAPSSGRTRCCAS